MTDDLDPGAKALIDMWMAGYFTGYEQGIKQVGWLLRNAKKHDCPIPDELADIIVAMGVQLEQQANKMTHEEAAAIREDESDG
jgi:hypothetical protein